MKLFSIIALASLTLFGCADNADEDHEESTGHEQVETPVMNSGAETERDRALEAIEQDTTNKEISVGKDPEGVELQKKDSTRN